MSITSRQFNDVAKLDALFKEAEKTADKIIWILLKTWNTPKKESRISSRGTLIQGKFYGVSGNVCRCEFDSFGVFVCMCVCEWEKEREKGGFDFMVSEGMSVFVWEWIWIYGDKGNKYLAYSFFYYFSCSVSFFEIYFKYLFINSTMM